MSAAETDAAPGVLRGFVTATIDVGRQTFRNWSDDRAVRLGAGLAYYGLFALVPLLALSLFLAGLIFSQDEVQRFLAENLSATVDADLDELSASVSQELEGFTVNTTLGVVGIVGLFIAGSLVFVALQDALTIIFRVERPRGVVGWIRRRALAFVVVLVVGSLLVAALAVQAVTGLVESIIPGQIAAVESVADLVGVLSSGLLGTAALVLLLRLLTFSLLPWRYAVFGAALIALGLAVGAWALGLYFSGAGARSLAGAVGGVLVLLVFIYYEAQVLLAGAELTNVLWRRGSFHGPPAPPPMLASGIVVTPELLEAREEDGDHEPE